VQPEHNRVRRDDPERRIHLDRGRRGKVVRDFCYGCIHLRRLDARPQPASYALLGGGTCGGNLPWIPRQQVFEHRGGQTRIVEGIGSVVVDDVAERPMDGARIVNRRCGHPAIPLHYGARSR
jgi:hypothetical protein